MPFRILKSNNFLLPHMSLSFVYFSLIFQIFSVLRLDHFIALFSLSLILFLKNHTSAVNIILLTTVHFLFSVVLFSSRVSMYCSYQDYFLLLFYHIVALPGLKLKNLIFQIVQYLILFCFQLLLFKLDPLCLHILVFYQKFEQISAEILRLILPTVPLLCGSPQIFSCSFSSKFFPLTS